MCENKTVLSIGAHPDDAEFMCVGTMALLADKGWKVHIASMAPGDCWSMKLGREQISKVRRGESTAAAKILKGYYHCMECDDIYILYDRETLNKVIKLLRDVKPSIVFAPSPSDYMVDHEVTSKVAQTACFAAGIPNVDTPGAGPIGYVPCLYYNDALAGRDILGNQIKPDIVVDITNKIGIKEDMLCCHASQRDWLMKHHGMDEYIESMKRASKIRGSDIGCDYGEGFRQHLGHGYPSGNILKTELGDFVHLL